MTKEQEKECHIIIHSTSAVAATVASGLAQIPGSDSTIIVPIQVTMIIMLGAVFGMELSRSAARATLGTTLATMVGRGISQFLVGWIPLLGNIINATTAAGITETIGWAIAKDFNRQSSKQSSKNKGKDNI